MGDLSHGGAVSSGFQISPDGTHVVYHADQQTDNVVELYSVPLAGGTDAKLNGLLVDGGNVLFSSFEISPDSSRVVYQADQETDNVFELYSVPLSGGTAVKLNGQLISNGDVSNNFQISPDSSQVVYYADQETNLENELYTVPLMGGTAIKLNGQLVFGGFVSSYFQISPDSSRVVYRASQQTSNVSELYSVPLGGGTAVKLNGALVSGGNVLSDFQISPDSSHVVYRADQLTDNVFELFTAIDEPPEVAFEVSTSSAGEGETIMLIVTLSDAITAQTTVDYAVTGGNATSSDDFTLADGTLTFDPGVTTQTITVNIVQDTLNEPDETVKITLANPINGKLGLPANHTLTILDDDDPPVADDEPEALIFLPFVVRH